MGQTLEHVIECQQRLIEALDARDAERLETATEELFGAVASLNAAGAVYDIDAPRLDHAIRQAQAARVRVNVLSDWTRQRIDRLAELRSKKLASYGNRRIYEPHC